MRHRITFPTLLLLFITSLSLTSCIDEEEYAEDVENPEVAENAENQEKSEN